MKDIIVYLDDYKYNEKGNYDIIYLDFRTIDDYYFYVNELHLEQTQGTFIEIDNYHSPKRLVRGAYYALNLEVLKMVESKRNENSFLVGYSYNFSDYDGIRPDGTQNKTLSLLQSHEPLNPEELKDYGSNKLNEVDELKYIDDLEFRVNDVGQANWNEVWQKGMVRLVYDIGAPITASKTKVRGYINQYTTRYANDHPCLVLSHWDKDHYHCLLGMTDAEIKSFSKFICVDKKMSVTSKQLFLRLKTLLGATNVYCISPSARSSGSDYPLMHEEFANKVVRVFTGESSRSTNYSGIVLFVKGDHGNVVFTGDCLPCQANEVLQKLNNVQGLNAEHYLVVPHHGGDFIGKTVYKTYQVPQGVNAVEAIISVDSRNNPYGHPNPVMLNWLIHVASWKIMRTDLVGMVVRRL